MGLPIMINFIQIIFMKAKPLLFSILIILFTLQVSAQKFAAGGFHSLFVCDNGSVKASGSNSHGQIGNANNTATNVPVNVLITNVVQVAAGSNFSLALKSDGTVWAWGENTYGQLGNGNFNHNNRPQQVLGLSSVIKITAGLRHAVALKSDGTVWCWGENSDNQLGNGNSTTNSNLPVQTVGLSGIVDVASKAVHTLALKNDSTVWGWGDNSWGVLGNGSFSGQHGTPIQSIGLNKVIQVDCGWTHSMVLKEDGTVWTWGYNLEGELGNGTTYHFNVTPTPINLSNIVYIGSGYVHSTAIRSDGTVWTWGRNSRNELGRITAGSFDSIPDTIPGIRNATHSDGYYTTLIRRSDSTVWGSGWNTSGNLGIGTNTNAVSPTQALTICKIGYDSLPNIITSSEELTYYHKQNKARIYPNPFTDKVVVSFEKNINGLCLISIKDIHGKLIRREEKFITKKSTLERGNLKSGLYLLSVQAIENPQYSFSKIISVID